MDADLRGVGVDVAEPEGDDAGVDSGSEQLPVQQVPPRRAGHQGRGHPCFLDNPVHAHSKGELSAVDAAKVKWWCADVQNEVLDACVQLYGGFGYMNE